MNEGGRKMMNGKQRGDGKYVCVRERIGLRGRAEEGEESAFTLVLGVVQ